MTSHDHDSVFPARGRGKEHDVGSSILRIFRFRCVGNDQQVLKLWMAEEGHEEAMKHIAKADWYGQSILSMLSYLHPGPGVPGVQQEVYPGVPRAESLRLPPTKLVYLQPKLVEVEILKAHVRIGDEESELELPGRKFIGFLESRLPCGVRIGASPAILGRDVHKDLVTAASAALAHRWEPASVQRALGATRYPSQINGDLGAAVQKMADDFFGFAIAVVRDGVGAEVQFMDAQGFNFIRAPEKNPFAHPGNMLFFSYMTDAGVIFGDIGGEHALASAQVRKPNVGTDAARLNAEAAEHEAAKTHRLVKDLVRRAMSAAAPRLCADRLLSVSSPCRGGSCAPAVTLLTSDPAIIFNFHLSEGGGVQTKEISQKQLQAFLPAPIVSLTTKLAKSKFPTWEPDKGLNMLTSFKFQDLRG